MKLNTKSKYLFLLILMCNLGVALSQKLHFTQVSPPSESPSWGLTTSMMQDRSGYMWFTTGNQGVQRFDGYNFKSYVNDPLDPNSIAPNGAECILEDSEGIIWIGTTGSGLERLDPSTGIFTHFVHSSNDPESIIHNDVKAIFEDHQGVLWVGTTGGLEIFDRKSQKFKHFTSDPNDPTTISNNCVKEIYEDSNNSLWFGTGEPWGGYDINIGGLNQFDRNTGKFIRYVHDENDPLSLIDNRITAIHEDSQGKFWIGTAEDGLHLMDRDKGTFQRLTFDPLYPDKLSRPALQPITLTGAVDHIAFIKEDKTGHIWIGTMGAGINRYDPKTEKVRHYGGDESYGGLKDMLFWSSFISRDGVIWISSTENNVFRVNPSQTRFEDINVDAFIFSLYQEESTMWIGTFDGLIHRDINSELNTKFEHDSLIPSSIGSGLIRSIVPDENGGLWVGTEGGGLNHFNPKTKSFTHYYHDENDLQSIDNDTITSLLKDSFSNLWIGTNTGLNMMKKGSVDFIHYSHDSLNTSSLSDSYSVSTLLEDEDQTHLWVGTYGGGLNRLDMKSGKFDHFLPDEAIFGMVQDVDGVIWAASNEGLSRYVIGISKFEKFIDPNGIFSSSYSGIEVDSKNNLWLTGETGIWQINSDRSLVHSYSNNNGVRSSLFYSALIFKDLNGAICFPYYPSSYYRILPDNIIRKAQAPVVLINDFKLGAESVSPGEGSPIGVPINEESEINLQYDQNIFSFDFTAIDFTNPYDNTILFKLENYDADWRAPGMDKTVQYINVSPGNYIFRIKAATNMGVFAEKEIIVNISPPWWLTWWAYVMYGFMFFIGVYVIHRFQKTRLLKAEREKSRDKELAQAKEIEKAYTDLKATQSQLIQSEKMASLGELTAGIAHEIQNPLNFVNNFSEVSNEMIDEMIEEIENNDLEEVKTIAKDVKQNLDKINHHGKRADAIVKGMLQHSRSSDGKKELTDINALADEYLRLAYHGLRAKDKTFNATLKTDFDDSIGRVNMASQDIGRVILNLITNAFYVVDQKKKTGIENYEPTVAVSTKKEGGKLEIKVSDNGSGIPKKLDKIFQPFFTTKPAGQGTGLGLSLSYDIVKAHGGTLTVTTEETKGTEFSIILTV